MAKHATKRGEPQHVRGHFKKVNGKLTFVSAYWKGEKPVEPEPVVKV
jgi:hypothetical protein